MSDTNPFHVIFALTAILILVSGFSAFLLPSFGVSMPSAPSFPSFASNLDWTVTLTAWSGIGSFFILLGGIIVYFCEVLAFMVLTLSAFLTFLGLFPALAAGITVLIIIVFVGSLLIFIRGSGDGSK